MHADVVEGAKRALLAAGYQDLLPEDILRDRVPRLAQFMLIANELPGLKPDFLLLAIEDRRVIILRSG